MSRGSCPPQPGRLPRSDPPRNRPGRKFLREPVAKHDKRGQFICYRTRQFYLLLTGGLATEACLSLQGGSCSRRGCGGPASSGRCRRGQA